MKRQPRLAEIIPIEVGIDRAVTRLNAKFQPALDALESGWLDLQYAMRGLSVETGVPVRIKRWEYQWPTLYRVLEIVDDSGAIVSSPAQVSVRGLLRHTPRSLAIGALDQLYQCQIAQIPILPSSQAKLWDVIESRTVGYGATITPTRPGTSILEDDIQRAMYPLKRVGVELMGVAQAEEAYTTSLNSRSQGLSNFMAYVDKGSQFDPNPNGGQFVLRAM